MMENFKWLRPYREWVKNHINALNDVKRREAREALKLIDRAMFPYPSTADKNRLELAVKYLNRKMNIHMLRQQINKRGKLLRISPPVSPNKKSTKKPGTSSPIKIVKTSKRK